MMRRRRGRQHLMRRDSPLPRLSLLHTLFLKPTCHDDGEFSQDAHVQEAEIALNPLGRPQHGVLLDSVLLRQRHVGLRQLRARQLVHLVMNIFARVHVKARVEKGAVAQRFVRVFVQNLSIMHSGGWRGRVGRKA